MHEFNHEPSAENRRRTTERTDAFAFGGDRPRSGVAERDADLASGVGPVNERILVTGGAGFIGSHLANGLAANNDVVVLDNFATGSASNLARDVEIVEGDVTRADVVSDLAADRDIVVHMAAMMGVRRTLENPLGVLEVNMEGTRRVLRAAVDGGAERVMFASTSEVYGDLVDPPYSEGDAMSPKTNYAVAKLADERYVEAFCEDVGVEHTIVRYFNVYGPRQESSEYGYVVPHFVKRALNDEPLQVHGDGTQTRDFTYIEDAVDATARALGPAGAGETFNVGTGVEVSVADLAQTVVDVVGSGEVEFVEHPRPYRIMRRGADISKAAARLGYSPKHDIVDGIDRLAETM